LPDTGVTYPHTEGSDGGLGLHSLGLTILEDRAATSLAHGEVTIPFDEIVNRPKGLSQELTKVTTKFVH
jgi:hypothetical protein